MKPCPRIRTTIKWGSTTLTVLLVVLWIASAWLEIGLHRIGTIIEARAGHLLWGNVGWVWARPSPGGWICGRAPAGFSLGLTSADDRPFHGAAPPLWLPVLACTLFTIAAWRHDAKARRRDRSHLCPECAYDRAGLAPDANCPECGTLPKP
jgi:hypothetical protein